MMVPIGVIWCIVGGLLLPLLSVSGIQIREEANERQVSTSSEPLTSTEPTDNGMTVGEAPLEATTTSSVSTPLFAVPSETIFSTVKPTVDAVFPDNHKNFTGSPYLGAIEVPPLLNNFNKYQNAYKEYYHQKNEFINAKPIKFEENHAKNRYITSGLSAYGEETQAGSNLHVENRPFPYVYEANHELPESSTVEEDTSHDSLKEQGPESQTGTNLFSQGEGSFLEGLFGRGSHLTTDHLHDDHHEHKSEHHHHHHHDHDHDHHDHKEVKAKKPASWKKVVSFLSKVIPFGLFLATLTPNFLQINTVDDNRPSRLRSLSDDPAKNNVVDPLITLVQSFGGIEAINDPVCEDRFFCEMSLLGKEESSNFVEKGFWFLANETPEDMAEAAGMKELFKAIKSNSCNTYDCKPKEEKPPESKDIGDVKHEESIKNEKKEVKPRKVKKFYRS